MDISFAVASTLPLFSGSLPATAAGRAAVVAPAKTRREKPSPTARRETKGGKSQSVGKTARGDSLKATKKTKVEVVVDDDSQRNKQLTRVGVALVGVSLLVTVVFPDGKGSTKKKEKLPPKRNSRDIEFLPKAEDEQEHLDDDKVSRRRRPPKLPSFSSMVKEEELFENSDELFAPTESCSEPEGDPSPPPSASDKSTSPKGDRVDRMAPQEERTPPKPQEKRGILGRIFLKPGGGRPTSLEDALAASEETADYRRIVARALLKYAPEDCLPSLDLAPLDEGADAQELISSARESSQLTKEEGAENFASVASSMMVGLVDHVVELSETKRTSKEEIEKSVVEAIDQVAVFINATGELFGKLYAGITIDPVVYNGKAKRGKLENIYYIYAKSSMNVASILSQADGSGDQLPDRVDNLGKVCVSAVMML